MLFAGTAGEEIAADRSLPLLVSMHLRLVQYKHDPLPVNAVVFADETQQVAIVSVDVCLLPDRLVRALQQACVTATGLTADVIILAATHTHVAPCTTNELVGDADAAFLEHLTAATVQAV